MNLWKWGIRHQDGDYRHAEGETIEEAAASLGWPMTAVKRYLPIKNLSAPVVPMPQSVKDHYTEKKKMRRELCEPRKGKPINPKILRHTFNEYEKLDKPTKKAKTVKKAEQISLF